MSDEFADSASVQFGITPFSAMDIDQIIAKGIRTCSIERGKPGIITHPREILEVTSAFGVFGQDEKLISSAGCNDTAVAAKCSDVDRTHMAGKAIEGFMFPKQDLSAVG